MRGPHRDLLPRVAVPTLVPHRKDDRAVRLAASREVASQIGGARFIELDGNDHWYFAGARQVSAGEIVLVPRNEVHVLASADGLEPVNAQDLGGAAIVIEEFCDVRRFEIAADAVPRVGFL